MLIIYDIKRIKIISSSACALFIFMFSIFFVMQPMPPPKPNLKPKPKISSSQSETSQEEKSFKDKISTFAEAIDAQQRAMQQQPNSSPSYKSSVSYTTV